MSDSPIGDMIMNAVNCTKCGAKYGACNCWTKCSCGWSYAQEETCGNPIHGGDKKPLRVIATGKLKL